MTQTVTPLPTGAAPGGDTSPAGGVSSRPGAVTWAGLAVVSVAAATLSFATVRDLADSAGYPPNLGWLLPVVIDATAVIGSKIWLGGSTDRAAVRYARGLALAAAVVTVGANVLQHGLSAYHQAPPWWLVAGLAAIPPIALVAVGHQIALLTRHPLTPPTALGPAAPAVSLLEVEPPAELGELDDLEGLAEPVSAVDWWADAPPVSTPTPAPALMAERDDEPADVRVRELAEQLAAGVELTGAAVARRYGVSDRQGRRLLATAQTHSGENCPDQADNAQLPLRLMTGGA